MPARPSASVPVQPVPAGTGTTRQVLIGPDEGPNFALRKFSMEPGGGMPLHTNTVEHEQYVLGGRARVVLGQDVLEVRKDDVVFIPGGVPHSYTALGDEPFEFLCVVPNLPDETRIIIAAGQSGDAARPVGMADGSDFAGDRSGTADGGAEEDLDDLVIPEDELGC
jgi:quercetin dioxygenase-like cupin family protein